LGGFFVSCSLGANQIMAILSYGCYTSCMKITSQDQQTLIVAQDNNLFLMIGVLSLVLGIVIFFIGQSFFLVALFLVVSGLFEALSWKNIRLAFDKNTQLATLTAQSLTGKRQLKYQLGDFAAVLLRHYRYRELGKVIDDWGNVKTDVILELKDGTALNLIGNIAVTRIGSSFSDTPVQKLDIEIAKVIANFLSVPCNTVGPISSVERKKQGLLKLINRPQR